VGTSGSTLTVPNASRVHVGDLFLKKSNELSPAKLTLTLSNAIHSDETYIQFEENGKNEANWYDAEKILSMDETIPQIFSISTDDQNNLINSLPLITNPVTVPLGMLIPAEGDYCLNASGIESLNTVSAIILEDRLNGTSQNLLYHSVYSFHASPDNDGTRFLLHFFGSEGKPTNNEDNPIMIFSYGKTLYISCNTGIQNGQIMVYSITGQKILTSNLNNRTINEVDLNVTDGYYVVRVQTQDFVRTAKVYLK
jgi:hypothetical protein